MADEEHGRISVVKWPEQLGNNRAPDQFNILYKHIPWVRAKIYDLGCGHGDLDSAMVLSGAKVIGVDSDQRIVDEVKARGLTVVHMDIEELIDLDFNMQTVICFSVLPYLKVPGMFLSRLNADTLFLECQYAGDGPGFSFLTDDKDMYMWLRNTGWRNSVAIGSTFVPGRDKYRTIWMCKRSGGLSW